MENIKLSIPYPPSVNRIYYNRKVTNGKLRGRGLTNEANVYKKMVADLIHYSFPRIKYGKQDVKVTILSRPPNKRGDNHNGLKIVFDAIQLSGLIDNDKQIVSLEIIPCEVTKNPEWIVKIQPYSVVQKALDFIRFFNCDNKTSISGLKI